MIGKIPKVFIDELLIKTNIIDLINARIPLKKQGQNYHARCPFHNEKTPSFTVNDKKQFYYCFGCNSHGNAIDFLINYERLTFIESIETLAILNRLTIPNNIGYKKNKNEYDIRNQLYCLMQKVTDLYKKNITNTDKNMAYLYLKKRGISKKMINYFSIGFAPKEWNNISNNIVINKTNQQALINAGILILNKKGNLYDRFRGRIIFPIKDNHGRISGFGARNLDNEKPKYINSPETNIFHKSRQLYGLYEITKNDVKPDKLLIVEGYIDVIMLTQFNINYVVGSLGTSITAEHIQLLFRNTNNIIYCYDGDKSGKEAAWRTLKISLPYIHDGRSIKFIFLPQDEDPDTIIRKEGKIAFENRIHQATDLSIFLFHKLLKNINLSSIEGRSHLSAIAVPLIQLVPGETMRIYLKQILGHKLGIPDFNQLERLFSRNKKKIATYSMKPIKQTSMRILISLLLQNPYLAEIIPSVKKLTYLKIKGLSLFLELVQICIKNPKLKTGQILEFYRDTDSVYILYKLAKWDHMIIEKEIKNVFLDLLSGLYNKILEIRQELLIDQERKKGLNNAEKNELWSINKKLAGI
ncbi:DNA primase [Buchnera aphidicola]|uniref:DNA primase n=1 Tax=Buchnera aphidicola TaxID=9 RepID=UPI003464E5D6